MIVFLFIILVLHSTMLLSTVNGGVLVIGGTGRVGRSLCSKLISKQIPTTVVVRDLHAANKLEELKGCTLVQGDCVDMESLRSAIKEDHSITSVIDVHGVKPPRFSKLTDLFGVKESDKTHPERVNLKGVQNLIQLAKERGIPKLVRITGALVGKANSPFCVLFNILLSFAVKYHELSEIAIRESGLDYVVIRPTGIREEPSVRDSDRHLICLPADSKESVKVPSKISLTDLSDLLVMCSQSASPSRSTLVVTTEEGPGPKKWEDALQPAISSGPDKIALKPGQHVRNAVIVFAVAAAIVSKLVLSLVGLVRAVLLLVSRK